jgi:hypothetical protein
MRERDYEFYIEAAKEKQGFKYDNQVDNALGFKAAMTTYLKQGKRHLSEDSMIKLAKLAGIDETIALMDLGVMKCDGEAQKAYAKILQKIGAMIALALGLNVLVPTAAMASTGIASYTIGSIGCKMAIALVYLTENNGNSSNNNMLILIVFLPCDVKVSNSLKYVS